MSPSEFSARARADVQLIGKYASETYIAQRAWEDVQLDTCPFHPEGGCGVTGHGSYPRVSPPGMRVARFYCALARSTISVLPAFMASRVTGTLAELEHVVEVAESAPTRAAAVQELRPKDVVGAVVLPAAQRWVRRRLRWVHEALTAVATLLGLELDGAPTLARVRAHLETKEALRTLRMSLHRLM